MKTRQKEIGRLKNNMNADLKRIETRRQKTDLKRQRDNKQI